MQDTFTQTAQKVTCHDFIWVSEQTNLNIQSLIARSGPFWYLQWTQILGFRPPYKHLSIWLFCFARAFRDRSRFWWHSKNCGEEVWYPDDNLPIQSCHVQSWRCLRSWIRKVFKFLDDPIFIEILTEKTVAFRYCSTYTIDQLKIILQDKVGIPRNQQRLIFNNKQLEDGESNAMNVLYRFWRAPLGKPMTDYNITRVITVLYISRIILSYFLGFDHPSRSTLTWRFK